MSSVAMVVAYISSQRICVYTGALSGTDDAECGCDGCLCNSDAESVDGTCQQVKIQLREKSFSAVHILFRDTYNRLC